ncbi:hypothetical protein AK51_03730 [Serratia nematodiphila DZ0503SBS1]|nr:hypothetical protein AK51_03730 [Serratia nematodiphila DZ0503SBS1]
MLGKSLTMFSLCMFILGVVSGITMSIGTFLITHMYAGRQRGSRLLFTDSFFSMAGMIFPIVAAMLLARHIGWYWVYACIGLLYVAIFVLTLCSEFPVLGKKGADAGQPVEKENGASACCSCRSPRCATSSASWASFSGCLSTPPSRSTWTSARPVSW